MSNLTTRNPQPETCNLSTCILTTCILATCLLVYLFMFFPVYPFAFPPPKIPVLLDFEAKICYTISTDRSVGNTMTKDEILEAAANIFGQKGYHAASMQDIAHAVNLQKASLYHHISSKQEILVELLDYALDLLISRQEEIVKKSLSPEEKLRQSMLTYLRSLAEKRDLSAVLLFEHRSLETELRERHLPRRDRFESLWRDMIQEGIDAGVFAPGDAGLYAKSLLGVMNWTIMWYRPEGPLSIEEIAEYFAEFFLHGLAVRE